MLLLNSLKQIIQIGSKKQLSNINITEPFQLIIPIRIRCATKSTGPAPVRLMGLGSSTARRQKDESRTTKIKVKPQSRGDLLDINETDWSSVYDAASSYNPNVIPLGIRMGRPRHSRLGDVPPSDKGNIELLKIPNFFHLTPPAIKKHCEALKDYCTPWPKNIGHRPVRVTTINHLYSGPSIRHPDSRRVKLQIYLKDIELDEHARRKFILLVGDRYNLHNDELTLITDKCPTRKQNKEYAYYLLTALLHESKKIESWEEEAIGKSEEEINNEVEEVRTELYPSYYKEKNLHRTHYRVIKDKLVRYNRYGHPFVYEMRKYGIIGGLSKDEFQLAKEEWEKIQTELPDTSTFDPAYKSSFSSEFSLV